MTIEKQSYLNEVLVRFRKDGSIAGAHQVTKDVLIDTQTGEVLNERARQAEPLDPAQVSAVLGSSFAAAAAQISRLESQIAALTQERDALKADAPPAPSNAAPLTQTISDRQFYQGLAMRGFCTPAEALDAVRMGALPAGLRAFVDGLAHADERWAAEMLLAGAKEFRRDHVFVARVAAWAGFDEDALDAFWAQCSAL